MSDLSDKKKPVVTEPFAGAAALGTEVRPPSSRVKIWAVAGGLLLALQIYVWIRWITGPYFERVPSGPSDPPMYMQVVLLGNAALMCVGLPLCHLVVSDPPVDA